MGVVDHGIDEGKVFFPTKSQIQSWIELECIVWMADEWAKGMKKAKKEGTKVFMVYCKYLSQKEYWIKDEVHAIVYGNINDSRPKGIGFYNPRKVDLDTAIYQVYEKIREELMQSEDYELLDFLQKIVEDK